MQPSRLRKTPAGLEVTWPDGLLATIPWQLLRDECPCAGCKGETLLLGKSYQPLKLTVMIPGMYELKNLEAVGTYAVQAYWGDGHSTGIYTWEWLRELCGRPATPS